MVRYKRYSIYHVHIIIVFSFSLNQRKIIERAKNKIIEAIPNADINVQFTFADEGGKT